MPDSSAPTTQFPSLEQPPKGLDQTSLRSDRAILLDGWAAIARTTPPEDNTDTLASRIARAAWSARLLHDPPPVPSAPIGECLFTPTSTTAHASTGDRKALDQLALLIDAAFADSGLGPLEPTALRDDDHDRIRAAVELLLCTVPDVAAPTLASVSIGVCMANEMPSMYLSMSPEVIYVGNRMIGRDTWELADAILHECLHDVTETMRQTRFLLAGDYVEDTSVTTLLPWSRSQPRPRYFSTWRLLSAGHVYVHLADLRRRLGLPTREIREPLSRARFMMDALAREDHADGLGTDGHALVNWLTEVTGALERSEHVA